MRLRLPLGFVQLEDRCTPATFTVTSLADAGAGTLRSAIAQAELDLAPDTIVFDSTIRGGVVNLTTFDTGVDANEFGPSAFVITTPITIQGSGEKITRLASESPFRLFAVLNNGGNAQLTLSDVELSGGLAQGGDGYGGGGGAGGFGGGIYNEGQLTLRGVTLSGNTAQGGDGGATSTSGPFGGGGGVGESAPTDSSGDGGGPNGGTGFTTFGSSGGNGGGGGAGITSSVDAGDGGFGGGGGGNNDTGNAGRGGFGGGGGAGGGSDGLGGFGGGNGDFATGHGGGGAGLGGGIFNNAGTVTIQNSTLSGNAAVAGISGTVVARAFGGGLFNYLGTVTIHSSTLTQNVGADGGRQVFALGQFSGPSIVATTDINNSILGQGDTLVTDFVGEPVGSGVNTTTGSGNLIRTAVGFNGGVFRDGDPLLGPLADNGGLTRTHLPLTGSPVLDAVAATDAGGLTTDQRGESRVSNGNLDIGSVEVQVPPPITVPPIIIVPPVVVPPVVEPPVVEPPVVEPPVVEPPVVEPPVVEPPVVEPPVIEPPVIIDPPPPVITYLVGVGADVQVRNADTSLLVSLPLFDPAKVTATVVAYADVNGDGVLDVIAGVGSGDEARVRVYDLVTNRLLFDFDAFPGFHGGISVAAADLNGDGVAEVVVGAGAGGSPHVKVFDLSAGRPDLIKSFYAYVPEFHGGVNVAATTGILVATAGPGGGPHVKVYAGLTDIVIASFYAFAPDFNGGVVAAVGDVNGDGIPDLVAGKGQFGGPEIAVFDGASASKMNDFLAYDPGFRGGVSVAIQDVNGDGLNDFIFWAGPGGGPHVIVRDARTLDLFSSYYATADTFRQGIKVA